MSAPLDKINRLAGSGGQEAQQASDQREAQGPRPNRNQGPSGATARRSGRASPRIDRDGSRRQRRGRVRGATAEPGGDRAWVWWTRARRRGWAKAAQPGSVVPAPPLSAATAATAASMSWGSAPAAATEVRREHWLDAWPGGPLRHDAPGYGVSGPRRATPWLSWLLTAKWVLSRAWRTTVGDRSHCYVRGIMLRLRYPGPGSA